MCVFLSQVGEKRKSPETPAHIQNCKIPQNNTTECVVCGATRKMSRLKPQNVVEAHVYHGVVLTTSYYACAPHFNEVGLFKEEVEIPVCDGEVTPEIARRFEEECIAGIADFASSQQHMNEVLVQEFMHEPKGWDVKEMSAERLRKLTLMTVSLDLKPRIRCFLKNTHVK